MLSEAAFEQFLHEAWRKCSLGFAGGEICKPEQES